MDHNTVNVPDKPPIFNTEYLIPHANEAHTRSVKAYATWRTVHKRLVERFERNNYAETTRRDIIRTNWDLEDAADAHQYNSGEANRMDILIIREEIRKQTIILGRIATVLESILTVVNPSLVPHPREEVSDASTATTEGKR